MLGKFIFWAFLLAAQRSRRATGYAIASVRCTMRASTHALRMPNAITRVTRVCMRIRVRDSSEKPAAGVACEDLQRIARPRSDSAGDTPKSK
jgi:hypothetical protein